MVHRSDVSPQVLEGLSGVELNPNIINIPLASYRNVKRDIPLRIQIIALIHVIFILFYITSGILLVEQLIKHSDELGIHEDERAEGEPFYELFHNPINYAYLLFLCLILLVPSLLLGVLFFFISRGLWRAKRWARISTIVIALALFVLPPSLLTLNINGIALTPKVSDSIEFTIFILYLIIPIYLYFSPTGKKYFKKPVKNQEETNKMKT